MSELYADRHRTFQDLFDSRRLADRLEESIVKHALDETDQRFIAARDMFFLATVDQHGRPTVSYKGGAPGFVRIVDERTIAFPSYDGNGMYFSMGNIAGHADVGLLFIDFEQPNRLRMQGSAAVATDDPLLADYPGAELIVRVAVQQVWVNCPRYIHRYQKQAASPSVPQGAEGTPLAPWKRLELMQDVIPQRDRVKVDASGGTISVAEYAEQLTRGDG